MQATLSPGPQKSDMFSPPPLEPMEPPKAVAKPAEAQPAFPTRNEFIQNGFSSFQESGSKVRRCGACQIGGVSVGCVEYIRCGRSLPPAAS